jgi:hypothetical protein
MELVRGQVQVTAVWFTREDAPAIPLLGLEERRFEGRNARASNSRGSRGHLINTVQSVQSVPQWLKPILHFAAFAARVNSCPVTNLLAERVFPQPVKPALSRPVDELASIVPARKYR